MLRLRQLVGNLIYYKLALCLSRLLTVLLAPSSNLGVWIDAGSRAESNATEGVAHFLEHMAFKVR
jgi:predicted Zn-dependent peptidase